MEGGKQAQRRGGSSVPPDAGRGGYTTGTSYTTAPHSLSLSTSTPQQNHAVAPQSQVPYILPENLSQLLLRGCRQNFY